MNTNDARHQTVPDLVEARLDARLTPFRVSAQRSTPEALDAAISPAVAPGAERPLRRRLMNEIKLLIAALGAGGSVVPLGDNGRTTRFLAEYAACLRRN